MPQYEVQVTAQITVSRRIVVDAADPDDAAALAIENAQTTPHEWEVPGMKEYTTAFLDPQELETFDTDEIEMLD